MTCRYIFQRAKKVALVGASGGGKSTLIQLLIGVYRQNAGSIRFNDELTEDIGFEVIRDKIAWYYSNLYYLTTP